MRIVPLFVLTLAIGGADPALALENATRPPAALSAAATLPATPDQTGSPDRRDPRFLAGRGCCSHHKGQCGCRNSHVECCDGTLSPSCRCKSDNRTGGNSGK